MEHFEHLNDHHGPNKDPNDDAKFGVGFGLVVVVIAFPLAGLAFDKGSVGLMSGLAGVGFISLGIAFLSYLSIKGKS